MGAAFGTMGAPKEGTAKDVRYTRSKDGTTLYAILLGWEKGEKEIVLKTLSSNRIDLKNLKSVELIRDEAGKYLPLTYKQDAQGLTVNLPGRSFEELAYVIKLSFDGKIPKLDRYANIDCAPHYYLVPGDNHGSLVLGANLALTGNRKEMANQWTLESVGKGLYKILNRGNSENVFECTTTGNDLTVSKFAGTDNQIWEISDARNEMFTISNKQFPTMILSVSAPFAEGIKAGLLDSRNGSSFTWRLLEVCETKQEAFKPHTIPCTIEAEDFDTGCPGDAYYNRANVNQGGQYRPNDGIGIEKCAAGGYNVGWTNTGEWMAYTVNVGKTAAYQISFSLASSYDSGKFHLECDGTDITGVISAPNTDGFQNWVVVKRTVNLDAGRHELRLVVDGDFFNIDKMVFEETK